MHIDDSPASSITVSGSPTDLDKFDGNVNSRHCPKRVRQNIRYKLLGPFPQMEQFKK